MRHKPYVPPTGCEKTSSSDQVSISTVADGPIMMSGRQFPDKAPDNDLTTGGRRLMQTRPECGYSAIGTVGLKRPLLGSLKDLINGPSLQERAVHPGSTDINSGFTDPRGPSTERPANADPNNSNLPRSQYQDPFATMSHSSTSLPGRSQPRTHTPSQGPTGQFGPGFAPLNKRQKGSSEGTPQGIGDQAALDHGFGPGLRGCEFTKESLITLKTDPTPDQSFACLHTIKRSETPIPTQAVPDQSQELTEGSSIDPSIISDLQDIYIMEEEEALMQEAIRLSLLDAYPSPQTDQVPILAVPNAALSVSTHGLEASVGGSFDFTEDTGADFEWVDESQIDKKKSVADTYDEDLELQRAIEESAREYRNMMSRRTPLDATSPSPDDEFIASCTSWSFIMTREEIEEIAQSPTKKGKEKAF